MTPKVSIVVCTTGTRVSLFKCLRKIVTTSTYSRGFEIVVVAETITPEVVLRCKAYNVKLVQHTGLKGHGEALLWNEGIAASRGELIITIDDDCIAAPDWLEQLVGVQQKTGAGIVGGLVLSGILRNKFLCAHQAYIECCFQLNEPDKLLVGTGMNIMYTREALRWLGKFRGCSPGYTGGDRDMNHRWSLVQNQGKLPFPTAFAEDAIVWHECPHTFKSLINTAMRYGKSDHQLLTLLKELGVPGYDLLMHPLSFYWHMFIYAWTKYGVSAAFLALLVQAVKFASTVFRFSHVDTSHFYYE